MTGHMSIMYVALFGDASVQRRGRLFSNDAEVQVKGDDGQLLSSHSDWEAATYASVVEAFYEVDEYVYFPRIVTGKYWD